MGRNKCSLININCGGAEGELGAIARGAGSMGAVGAAGALVKLLTSNLLQ